MPAGEHPLHDEVLTGEAVALDVQPVGFLMRALGLAIDVVVTALFVLLSAWLLSTVRLTDGGYRTAMIILVVVAVVVLPTTVETATRGRSLGKLAVGSRIVRSDGGAIGFRHAFIRSLVGLLEIWLSAGGLAAVVGMFTPRAQRLGDLVAGTYAERTRAPQLPSPELRMPGELVGWAEIADVARLPDPLARRISRFIANAHMLSPQARMSVAAELAAETEPFVTPIPAVPAELMLIGVSAVRRERELRALRLRDERVARLVIR